MVMISPSSGIVIVLKTNTRSSVYSNSPLATSALKKFVDASVFIMVFLSWSRAFIGLMTILLAFDTLGLALVFALGSIVNQDMIGLSCNVGNCNTVIVSSSISAKAPWILVPVVENTVGTQYGLWIGIGPEKTLIFKIFNKFLWFTPSMKAIARNWFPPSFCVVAFLASDVSALAIFCIVLLALRLGCVMFHNRHLAFLDLVEHVKGIHVVYRAWKLFLIFLGVCKISYNAKQLYSISTVCHIQMFLYGHLFQTVDWIKLVDIFIQGSLLLIVFFDNLLPDCLVSWVPVSLLISWQCGWLW